MNALAVTHLALAPLVVKQLCTDRHKLRLEEIAQFTSELVPPLREVKRLREVDTVRYQKTERDGRVPSRTDVVLEHNHLVNLPGTPLPSMHVSFAVSTASHELTHVHQFKFELDAVGGDRLVRVDFDRADDGMVGIESASIAFKTDAH